MLQEKSDKKIHILMIAATIIIGAVFFTYLYSRPVNNYSFDISTSKPDLGRVEEDGYYFDSAHADALTEEAQKVYLNIPKEVKAGSYTLRIGYRSNAGSTLSVASKVNPLAVKCDQVALTHMPKELPGEFNMNYGLGYLPGFTNSQMYITKDVNDLDVYIVYCGFKEFYIQSVELIGNRNYVKTIWLSGMFLLIIVELLVVGFINGFWKSEKGISVLTVVAVALLSSIPLAFKMGLLFDDGIFLYGKINGIADGIIDGQFPVRIHPNTLQGFGYALSYFYPEAFLYPFAILRLIGYSLRFCVYALIFCINLATVAVSFLCVKRVIKVDSVAIKYFVSATCAFLYTFNPYRLIDIYSRGAIAEALAIIFLPLIVTGVYVIIVENGSISWLVAGAFGLVNSHVLSCEMVAFFAVLLCVICFRKVFKKECLLKLLSACGITALLSAYYIIPFLHMSSTDSYKVYAENAYDTSNNMLSIKDIVGITVSTVGKVNNGTFFDVRYTLGIAIVVLSILLFIWTVVNRKNGGFGTICFAFGVIALWLSSSLFPWKEIESMGGIFRTVFCMVQFPWRYLSIAMVCFMFVIAEGFSIAFSRVNENVCNKEQAHRMGVPSKVVHVMAVIACTLVFAQAIGYFSTLSKTASDTQLIYDGAALNKYSMVGMGEYEPVAFDDQELDYSIEELQYMFDEDIVINPTGDDGNTGLTIGPLSKSGTDSSILIINPTGEEKILYMPITYYRGYLVENVAKSEDGIEAVPELFETEYGTVGLKVPAGYYNGVHITYKENIIYRISELISVLTLAGLALLGTRKNERE